MSKHKCKECVHFPRVRFHWIQKTGYCAQKHGYTKRTGEQYACEALKPYLDNSEYDYGHNVNYKPKEDEL